MITTSFSSEIMQEIFTGTKTFYVGLSSTSPTTAGSASEPSTSGNGYARVKVTFEYNSTNDYVTNTNTITFEATSDWGTMSYYVIYDSLTGGTLLLGGALASSRTIQSGTAATIASGELTVKLTG